MVSLWELTIKTRAGKLTVDVERLSRASEQTGFVRLAIELQHVEALRQLSAMRGHRDPFDHLIIAQALVEDATVVTADRRFHAYPIAVLPL